MPNRLIKGRQKCQIQSKHKMMIYLQPLALTAGAILREEQIGHVLGREGLLQVEQSVEQSVAELAWDAMAQLLVASLAEE